ncbi:hypothetical protein L202_05861 [Cryptococcus amylolentus CBS 6039]|uniref:Uncharacterized protein n=1 Tax=Cryptococcus amylolentus CBS 6039 TaxID=1295533 RepID=A0A1E3HHP6_9TREE|nr:hypothetical protein L202_05861 [Cryptococcus amylolentus CBS 6039]ODN75873.1 hypothetical protein L202_05861 [Cryptococcus amylolentus CBS 6039]
MCRIASSLEFRNASTGPSRSRRAPVEAWDRLLDSRSGPVQAENKSSCRTLCPPRPAAAVLLLFNPAPTFDAQFPSSATGRPAHPVNHLCPLVNALPHLQNHLEECSKCLIRRFPFDSACPT